VPMPKMLAMSKPHGFEKIADETRPACSIRRCHGFLRYVSILELSTMTGGINVLVIGWSIYFVSPKKVRDITSTHCTVHETFIQIFKDAPRPKIE